MARATTVEELALHRTPGDWSRFRLAIHLPQAIYTARVNGVPASNDMVNEIDYDGGSGTLADIHDDMLMYVGTSAGARDLGMVRIRKAPTSSKFYFGETSIIQWANNAYLTVVDAFAIRERPVRVVDGVTYMDSDIEFDDQHIDFDPVPVLGPHIVERMEGADVEVTLGPPSDTPSWVFDSTIASVEWVIPDATAIDDDTAINPVATFETVGWHACYCTVTADQGKSFEGVRYVYIWNTENPPARAFAITRDPEATYEDGGWSFGVDLYDEASLGLVRDGALVILFAEDWYGETKQSIGPVEGRENIIVMGWIAGESIEFDPETGGRVQFIVQGPQYWMKQNNKYGMELTFALNTPDAWNVMVSLSVARAVWHLLHWRFNVTKLMDVTLTDDERMTLQIKVASHSLWSQIEDIAWKKIFARPGCDRYGRFWLEIDPQMVPAGDRDWAVVQTLTKKDWEGKIEIERRTQTEICILFASGEMASAGGSSNTLYSLSPGHMPLPYGDSEILENLLVSDQTQANEQAGLYMGWRNNELPDVRISMPQNNRMIDLWPRQFLDISIAEEDTLRGIVYSGNLIPRSITLRVDGEAGTLSTQLGCEAETFAYPAINGDIPESAGGDDYDFSIPSLPGFDLPPFGEIVYPSPTDPNANHPKQVVIASANFGVLYTLDFDEDNPTWQAMNGGLSPTDITDIYNMLVTPSGAIYLQLYTAEKVMRASSVGGMFVEVASQTQFPNGIHSIGVNPQVNDQVLIAGLGTTGVPSNVRLVNNGVLGSGAGESRLRLSKGISQFINGKWFAMGSHFGLFPTPWICRYSAGGALEYDDSINTAVGQDAADRFSQALPNTIFQWDNSGAFGFNIISSLSGTPTPTVNTTFKPNHNIQGFAFSPTGVIGMGADTDVLNRPYKTTDGGASFSIMTGTISVGSDIWENCKDDYRWIFGGGTTIHLTVDAGATYITKAGNLGYIAPLIDITNIRFMR